MNNTLLIIVGIIAISLSIYAMINTYTLGSAESDFEVICLGGHQYYRANFAMKGMVAIRLNNEGRPIKCIK